MLKVTGNPGNRSTSINNSCTTYKKKVPGKNFLVFSPRYS